MDDEGRVVLLHGVNAVWKHAPYAPPETSGGFSARDADWLAANGFNAVRLGVLFAGVMPERGVISTEYLDAIARVVALLAARGIWVQLDFHQDMMSERYQGEGFPPWAVDDDGLPHPANFGFPGNYFTPEVMRAFDNFWSNADGVWDHYRDAWAAVAARFGRHPFVMGYDVMNEPWPGSDWVSCANPAGCLVHDALELQRLHEHVIAGIRAVDPTGIVWIEPNVIFNSGAKTNYGALAPIADANLGFSFHDYCLTSSTTYAHGVPAGPDCPVQERIVFDNAREAEARIGAASLLTEFGASDDLSDVASVAKIADERLTGWMYWHYKNWADPTTSGGSTQGLFADDRDLTTERPKVDVLVRPFPAATMGEPMALSFDPDAGDFRYRYRPSSGDAPTVILVPAERHYPGGYEIVVDGGAATRLDHGRRVEVRADAGATEVDVHFFPMR